MNLATGRISGVLAPGVSTAVVAQAVTAAGYEAVETVEELRISGMTCASCVGRVEKALRRVPGVRAAGVNLAAQRATVRRVGGLEMNRSLVDALAEAGYEADPVLGGAAQGERDGAASAAELTDLRNSVLPASLATAPLLVFEMGTHLPEDLHRALAGSLGSGFIMVLSLMLASLIQFGPSLLFAGLAVAFPSFRVVLNALRLRAFAPVLQASPAGAQAYGVGRAEDTTVLVSPNRVPRTRVPVAGTGG